MAEEINREELREEYRRRFVEIFAAADKIEDSTFNEVDKLRTRLQLLELTEFTEKHDPSVFNNPPVIDGALFDQLGDPAKVLLITGGALLLTELILEKKF